MLTIPDIKSLTPQVHTMPDGRVLHFFHNEALQLVKLDFILEAGSSLQEYKCQSHAANQLFGEATAKHDERQVAEFLDFRGIVVERMVDVCAGSVTFYFLRRYAEELFPLIREMFDSPQVSPQMFQACMASRRQQLATGFQKTSYMARNKFYELLYGLKHPLGTYAKPDDVDSLRREDVCDFMRRYYRLADADMVVSGCVDEKLLSLFDRYLSVAEGGGTVRRNSLPQPCAPSSREGADASAFVAIPSAVQSTIRIGRILPYAWDDPDYARFMVLNTVLGGYFGSRLMSNLREEKGYTYGIYSMTQIHRGSIVFSIIADVAGEASQKAVDEVYREMNQLRQEPVTEEELGRVRNYMLGDFIRSIDGVFEVSERYCHMSSTFVTEQLTTNLLDAIATVTPLQLQALAQTCFTGLATVVVGREE